MCLVNNCWSKTPERLKKYLSGVFVCKHFLKNHRKTKDSVIDEIYTNMKDKEKLINTLLTMIDECYATLFDEEDNEGNIEWDTVGLK